MTREVEGKREKEEDNSFPYSPTFDFIITKAQESKDTFGSPCSSTSVDSGSSSDSDPNLGYRLRTYLKLRSNESSCQRQNPANGL